VEIKTDDELALEAKGELATRELKLQRKRVLVPIDDAAKASVSGCQEAIDTGLYKPAKGEAPEEMKKKLRERETKLAATGKGLPT
jgi:hypothetical protein